MNPEYEILGLRGNLKTLEELDQDFPCLALLGEAGLGKSYAVTTLRTGGPEPTLYLDLAEFSGDDYLYRKLFGSDQIQEWERGTHRLTVLLDSFDECQMRLDTLAGFLRREFEALPHDRLRLRIASRTHAWPQSLDQTLRDWWGPGYGAFELVPLHPGHVKEAAEAKGVSVDGFLRSVDALGLESLASRPLTLDFLLEEFARGGQLPTGLEQVYGKGLELLVEWDQVSRRESRAEGKLEPLARLALARRLAAVAIFCGRPAITLDTTAPPEGGCLSILDPDLTRGTEPDRGEKVEVASRRLEEVLGTGLFTGGESERIVWSHRTFAEFLAAQYLEVHEFRDEQVCDLLFHRDERTGAEGVIPPQLRDTAMWAALHRPALVDRILRTTPEVLVSSTLAEHPEEVRARVVDGLLKGVAFKRIHSWDRNLRADYRWLGHPGIGEQLRPWITDQGLEPEARRVAIEVAWACDRSELAPTLAERALDPSEPYHLRTAAAWSVANLPDVEARRSLRPFLAGDPSDVDDELRGAALEALWPGDLTAGALFDAIVPPRSAVYGLYEGFLSRLPEQLKTEHLPDALRWVQNRVPDWDHPYLLRRLLEAVLSRAWRALGVPGVMDALVEVALHRIKQGSSILETDDRATVEAAGPSGRRSLLTELVPRISAVDPNLRWDLQDLVWNEDFDWLTDRALEASDSEDRLTWQSLAAVAARSGLMPQPEHLDRVMELQASLPELRERLGYWIDTVDLDSKEAADQRSIHQRSTRRKQPRTETPDFEAQVVHRLDEFDQGKTQSWWILNMELTQDSSQRFGGEFEIDLTALQSWTLLSAATRERCLATGRRYLEVADPATGTWLGTNVLHPPAAAGARAMLLLQRLRPEALLGLSGEVWGRWTPILLAFPGNTELEGERAREALLSLAWEKAFESFKRTLFTLIDVEKKEREGFPGVLHRLGPAIKAHRDLQAVLLDNVREAPDLGPQSLNDLLEPPLECSHPAAFDLARAIASAVLSRPRAVQIRAASLLLRYHPWDHWDLLWPMLSGDPDLARALLVCYGSRLDASHETPMLHELHEQALADLYDVLCRLYPPSEFSQLVSGFVGPEHRIAEIRDAIPGHLVSRGNLAAVTALSRLFERFPDQPWLAYRVTAADTARVERAYEPISPAALLEMASSNTMRALRSGSDLLELVAGALREFQEDLHREPFRRENLWNEHRPKPESQLRDLLWDYLRTKLGGLGVIADREVLVGGSSETDIHVTAVPPGQKPGLYQQERVILEIKGDWHKDVKKAMETQLLERYLKEANCSYGIYVVGWFGEYGAEGGNRSGVQGVELDAVRSRFEGQAADLSGARQLLAVVLDASRTAPARKPERPPGKRPASGRRRLKADADSS